MSCSRTGKGIVPDSIGETFRVPAGKEDRSIVRHVGSAETGLLNNCLLISEDRSPTSLLIIFLE